MRHACSSTFFPHDSPSRELCRRRSEACGISVRCCTQVHTRLNFRYDNAPEIIMTPKAPTPGSKRIPGTRTCWAQDRSVDAGYPTGAVGLRLPLPGKGTRHDGAQSSCKPGRIGWDFAFDNARLVQQQMCGVFQQVISTCRI